ncbi:hypothetical protein [Rhodohalobacter sp. SW132]|uniref:hypothetical protein n=1 Tax=Rhodohalobacter sp. SW132 TaxID=2293433 RepID=UPI0011C04B6F|nr:hypothetical protein [Rhodohalobacter sp. SW132]
MIVSAQSGQTKSISIHISANFQNSIELLTIQTLDFHGLDRQNPVLRISPISSGRAGKMIASGLPGSEFRLNYIRDFTIRNPDGPGSIAFRYRIAGNHLNDQNSAEPLEQTTRELQFNEDGEFFIWIGGDVDLSNAAPGIYDGEFTIEIEYI